MQKWIGLYQTDVRLRAHLDGFIPAPAALELRACVLQAVLKPVIGGDSAEIKTWQEWQQAQQWLQ